LISSLNPSQCGILFARSRRRRAQARVGQEINAMMGRAATALTVFLAIAWPACAELRTVAVFDFELTDTARQDQLAPHNAEHVARLALVSGELRKKLAESGRFTILDIAPIAAAAHAANLQSCGGCDITLARSLDADYAITGMVYKVSDLILNMMIFIRDTRTGANVAVAQADMRGDTDVSWVRTVGWLVRNRILDPDRGLKP